MKLNFRTNQHTLPFLTAPLLALSCQTAEVRPLQHKTLVVRAAALQHALATLCRAFGDAASF